MFSIGGLSRRLEDRLEFAGVAFGEVEEGGRGGYLYRFDRSNVTIISFLLCSHPGGSLSRV